MVQYISSSSLKIYVMGNFCAGNLGKCLETIAIRNWGKQGWTDGEVHLLAVTTEIADYHGSSYPSWVFRVVLIWVKGPGLCMSCWPVLGCRLRLGRGHALGKVVLFRQEQPTLLGCFNLKGGIHYSTIPSPSPLPPERHLEGQNNRYLSEKCQGFLFCFIPCLPLKLFLELWMHG